MNESALSIATNYYRSGLQPLPIEFREKNPNFNGWQKFKTTEADLSKYFNGKPQNIGVLLGAPSNFVVDLDFDTIEARRAARCLLPKTATFGRASSPFSHSLVRCQISTKKYQDPLKVSSKVEAERKAAMLVEIRSTGCQTVFPGSTHKETGERIEWTNGQFDEPLEISAAELQRIVGQIAAAALLATYWRDGIRNELTMALSGALIRHGFDQATTLHFIKAVCIAAQDEETEMRIATARSTVETFESGAPTTGLPKLIELTDKKIVDAVCKWLNIETRPADSDSKKAAEKQPAEDLPLNVICLKDVEPENISWLWFPYIAKRKLTLISGEEGLGKSWLTCAFAAAVSTGAGFPPNFEKQEPGNVLMLSAEDGLADTIKPRLISCGADTNRIFAPDEVISFDEKGLLRLEMYIAETSPVIVTVDPLFAYTPGKVDVNSANQSRSISAVLAKIAEKYDCAILLIRHIGKSKGFGDPRAAGLGSIDWRAAVRSELLVGKNPDNEQERAIVHTKSNLAEFGSSIGFQIQNSLRGARLEWTGTSSMTAACILSTLKDEDARADQTHSVDFLREILSDGAKPAKEVKKQASENGLTEQNLRTARNKLQVVVRKQGDSFDRSTHFWVWELPTEGVSASEDVTKNNDQHLRQDYDNKTTDHNDLTKDVSNNNDQHLREEINAKDVTEDVSQHLRESHSKQTTYNDEPAKDVSRNFSNALGNKKLFDSAPKPDRTREFEKPKPENWACSNSKCSRQISSDAQTCPYCNASQSNDF